MLPGATAIHCSVCGETAPEWWAAYGRPALCNRCEPEDCPGCGGSGYRDAYAFGGGLHCATADVYREGTCQDYFPNQIADPTLV